MAKYKIQRTLSSYSIDSDEKGNVSDISIYNSARYPGLKLIRLENDESCLKYLQKRSEFKKRRYKTFYDKRDVFSSESDSCSEDLSNSDFTSDNDSLSCDQFIETQNLRLSNEFYDKTDENKWSLNSNGKSLVIRKNLETRSEFQKYPVIKLIRLENDENCHKYLNRTPRTNMLEKKTDGKKLSPIVIVQNVHGKHKPSFMIKKNNAELSADSSEDSKDGVRRTSPMDDSYCQNLSNKEKQDCRVDLSSFASLDSKLSILPEVRLSHTESSQMLTETNHSKSNGYSSESHNSLPSSNSNHKSVSSKSHHRLKNGLRKPIMGDIEIKEPVVVINSIDKIHNLGRDCSYKKSKNDNNFVKTIVTVDLESEASAFVDIGPKEDGSEDTFHQNNSSISVEVGEKNSSGLDKDVGVSNHVIDIQFLDDDEFDRLFNESPDMIDASCEVCDETFASRPTLYEHMKENHNCVDIYECDYCGHIFNNKTCLVVHLYASLSDKITPESHICPQYLCSKEDFTESELNFLYNLFLYHFEVHKSSSPSSNVDANVTEEITDKASEESHSVKSESPVENSKRMRRKLVDENFNYGKVDEESNRSNQNFKRRKGNSNSSSKFSCYLCGEYCRKKSDLFDHFTEIHDHFSYYECPTCEKLFQKSFDFAAHFLLKNCGNINDGFYKKDHFKHMRCDICGRDYKNREILRTHKMTIHHLYIPQMNNVFLRSLREFEVSDDSFSCMLCYENCESFDQLCIHEESNHSFYSCFRPLCSQKFLSESSRERHMFTHISMLEGRFCECCDKLFFCKAHLQKHLIRQLAEQS